MLSDRVEYFPGFKRTRIQIWQKSNLKRLALWTILIFSPLMLISDLAFASTTPDASSPEDNTAVRPFFPTPTPNPTVTPYPQCVFNRLNLRVVNNHGLAEEIYKSGDANVFPCVDENINSTISMCQSYLAAEQENIANRVSLYNERLCRMVTFGNEPAYQSCLVVLNEDLEEVRSGKLLDDCIADSLFGFYPMFRKSTKYQVAWSLSPWAENATLGDFKCRVWSVDGRPYSSCGYQTGTIYLDNQCNALRAPANAGSNVCDISLATVFSCPVSLIWEEGYDPDSDPVISMFPLNPLRVGELHLWKGSAKAPLLVYDPKHTGKITEARQLFGNWTFGGKGSAKIGETNIYDIAQATDSRWKNGFEALASLDKNNDREISGEELKPLALWFDKNRNSISEIGEVRTMTDSGVSKLFYTVTNEDAGTKTLEVSVGYERIIDGKRVYGKSIDWWSASSVSRSELLLKHQLQRNALTTFLDKGDLIKAEDKVEQIAKSSISNKSDVKTLLPGAWRWESKDEMFKGDVIKGYLTFVVDSKGGVTGHTYGMANPGENNAGIGNILTKQAFSGQATEPNDGQIKLKFLISNTPGSVIETTATLDVNKKEIRGETVAKVSYGTKPVNVSYKWVAKKL